MAKRPRGRGRNAPAQAKVGNKTQTKPADANQPDNKAVGNVHLGPDTPTDGTDQLADARTDESTTENSGQNGAPTAQTIKLGEYEQNQIAGSEVTGVVPAAELVGDHAIQKNVSASEATVEENAENSQSGDEGQTQAKTDLEGSAGESSEQFAEGGQVESDSEPSYHPLMSPAHIAQAATEAAISVAYQAGFSSEISEGDEDILKLIVPLAIEFIERWPEAPIEALYIHAAEIAKLPYDQFEKRPHWVRLALTVFRSVVLLSLDAEKAHYREWLELEYQASQVQSPIASREDLAMTPDDDNPLSELGQAALRS